MGENERQSKEPVAARRRPPRPPCALVALASLLLLASPLSAQTQAGEVSGVILDATTRRPLAGATVTLIPLPDGLVAGAGGTLVPSSSVETSDGGRYRFDGLAPGRYRLRIERLGYRAVSIETEVRRPRDTRIGVALELAPLALEPLLVRERATPPFRRVAFSGRDGEGARVALERGRQDEWLTPDSRVVTLADLAEAVTLGEGDVFRALQRFPGVATRDDYTAELWTRGAPWAHTRVTFDGQPLFNPVHAAGVFSAVVPDVLGAVHLHSGVRPASLGDGVAGTVDLRTRSAAGEGKLAGAVDASMASGKLTLEQRTAGGRAAWLVSARRSYIDVLENGFGWLGVEDLDLPYAFHDIAFRGDLALGERAALESSVLWEEDRLFGDFAGVVERTAARWGNTAGRITLSAPVGGVSTRHTAGVTRYDARIREAGDSTLDARGRPWIEPQTDNAVLHFRLAGETEPLVDAGALAPWAAGWELVHERVSYDGPEPRFHPVRPDTTERIEREDAATRIGLWAEHRASFGRLSVRPGLRAEHRLDAGGSAAPRVAPRVVAQLTADADTRLSAALGRTWQDLHALALAGPSAHPAFHAGRFWLQAGDSVPALRSDQVTMGIERWLGGHWLAAASLFARRTDGLALPDPRPGRVSDGRPLFVTGEERAHGTELSVRRISGAWTAMAAWTWGEAETRVGVHAFPSAADRRQRLDATLAARLPAGFQAGLAWTAMTGAPFTRVIARAPVDCDAFGFECGQVVGRIERPHAERTPAYASLDAMLAWQRDAGRLHVSAYVQLRNVLDRDNASTYSGTVPRIVRTRAGVEVLEWVDRFEAGLPRLPLFGARIAF